MPAVKTQNLNTDLNALNVEHALVVSSLNR